MFFQKPDFTVRATRAFLACAIWADAPEGTRPRVTKTALEAAAQCVVGFVASLPAEVKEADFTGYSVEQFGHDLYLTLAGHGTGFWERKELEEELPSGATLGEELTRYCAINPFKYLHGYGYLEFYRGWVYLRNPAN